MQNLARKGTIGTKYNHYSEKEESDSEDMEDERYWAVDREVVREGCMRAEDRVEVELWLNKN